MAETDANSITSAVLARVEAAPDPRVRELSQALIRHLHAFVRETALTQAEWMAAIEFLTQTGQMCDGERQEFILLSDTLGVSMLVDAINNRAVGGETESTVLGPFYVPEPKTYPSGSNIAGAMKGIPLYIQGSVTDPAGAPIRGAIVDIWHSDEGGLYDVQQIDALGGYSGRARLGVDAQGRFACWTIKPIEYAIPDDGPVGGMLKAQGRHPWRPAHVHFMIAAPGYRTLVTHIFVKGGPYLDSDAVFGVKEQLIAEFSEHPPGVAPDGSLRKAPYATLNYDFRLAKG